MRVRVLVEDSLSGTASHLLGLARIGYELAMRGLVDKLTARE